MKRWLVIGMLVPVGFGALVYFVGFLLPQNHRASVSFSVPRGQEEVWRLITEVDRFAQWRPTVDSVERRADGPGGAVWVEHGPTGALPLYVREAQPPRRLVLAIADGLPFGGTWTYEIEPEDSTLSRLTITEDGEVYSPIFRVFSRFVFGHDATLNEYREAVLAVGAA